MTNENAFTPLELLAMPFLLIGFAILWLNDKTFGRPLERVKHVKEH